ncbi:Biopolymer transport protein ExbD/TolR [Chondromyces apiculatus DSM 436]|uniref:Biopolymer transport protein ExbD/TolR n=1 Tax=Chondromyces apiculatus DSM 436 TaxID=1192034 RepID=A0A017T7R2_9BACT|nr:Biopolymer transport protein ExbD/TolR [Chondromyces apiculatus DSM 436]
MESTRSRRPQLEPEINVTPLVDVVLVLLIIFMVVAPQLEHGERVELPAVFQPDAKSKAKLDPIYVTVAASGRLFLEKEPVEGLAALEGKLREVRAAEPERRVVLKGDGAVKYHTMREAFALCQGLGFAGISLQVSQRGGGKGMPAGAGAEGAPEEG